jgi:8-oxo-dGTP diphosphatase
MLVSPDGAVLLQHRAEWSHHGGTWGVPGGARASFEPAPAAALREATEEAAVPAAEVRPSHAWIEDHRAWSYTTLVGQAPNRVHAYPSDPESKEIRWVPFDDVPTLPLHPGFAARWDLLREHALRRLVVFVDAANVVGATPDGWWRDRLGATARLRDALAGTARGGLSAASVGLPGTTWWPDVHLVVEGQARSLPAVDGVSVHPALADGDSALAGLAAEAARRRPQDHVVVVTADRALRAAVTAAGASPVGPRTLLDALSDLPEPAPTPRSL